MKRLEYTATLLLCHNVNVTNNPILSSLMIRIVFVLLVLFPIVSYAADHNSLRITFSGVDKQQETILKANLSLKDLEGKKHLKAEDIVSLYQLALIELNTTLETLGYYHPTVYPSLQQTDHHYTAHYRITLGPPVLIHNVTLKIIGPGKNNPKLEKSSQKPPFVKGDILNHEDYKTFKEKLLEKILAQGYLDAHYETNEIRIDLNKNQADIFLILDTEKQYKIGKIDFLNPPYPIAFLEGYIPFKKQSDYTTDKIVEFQKVLVNSDLFSQVIVEPELSRTKDLQVPLSVRLTPKPHNKYTASIGFGTDTGPRGGLGWERRRSAYPGHRINISTKSSRRLNQANAQYTLPGKNPITDRYSLGTQIVEERQSDNKYSLRHETTVGRFQKIGNIEEILALQYLSESYRDVPTQDKKHSHFLLPNFGFTWSDFTDKRSLLKTGMRVTVNLKGGTDFLLSTTNMVQVESRVKWALPLSKLTRLILRGSIGATGTSHFDKIPLSLRFFAGGDYSVRGYGYRSLGPREKDADGNEIVVGGRYLLLSSVEIEQKIYKKVGVAIFIDSGNAMNHWKTHLYSGAGFGFRYETPLGPLRLDIARPLERGKHRPRIHFTFGVDL